MYKPGTLVTLKDGRIYRTSKKMAFSGNKCMNFYAAKYELTPCSMQYTGNPFGMNDIKSNQDMCMKLFGMSRFPKLVTLCGK